MPERRGTRFVVEVLFLAALAAALAFADLDVAEIVGAMAIGWLVVAALEWAAWRGEPHYSSGLPPRYFVPSVNLPPPQPLEQVDRGYPGASREEAPTWIASAALRAELLGEWPVAASLDAEDEDDESEFVADLDADPWTVAELPAGPFGEDDEAEEPVLPPKSTTATSPPRVQARRPGGQKALYRFDPLGPDAAPRRRFRRAAAESTDVIEVEARPSGVRPLPGAMR